ncbi:MAG TPA: hypothetical protein VK741_15280, partial [Acetobacteraceae bacterium]|nr:hypothetical protein [Acetobacteraceae bacterium]
AIFVFVEDLLDLGLQLLAKVAVQRDGLRGEAFEQQCLKAGVLLLDLGLAEQAAEIFADIAIALLGELGFDKCAMLARENADCARLWSRLAGG